MRYIQISQVCKRTLPFVRCFTNLRRTNSGKRLQTGQGEGLGYVALFLLVDCYQVASLVLKIIITSNKIEDIAQMGG